MLGGSVTIARVAGIPIRVHWTFALLLVWIVAMEARGNGSVASAALSTLFVLVVFLCVTLHELGHALAAKVYGVRTRSITLLPIGGVAALERIPEKPAQELVIAVAGPLVNVAIAGALIAGLLIRGGLDGVMTLHVPGADVGTFLASVAAVNIWLVLFNMIPAFPMDGGRVLRALLATVVDYAHATRVAALIGQGVAFLMALGGIFSNPILLLIALFVWIAATAESQATQARFAFRGLRVSAAMVREFRVLARDHTLRDAADLLLAGSQQDFPVTDDGSLEGELVGVLTRDALIAALAARGPDTPVASAMRPCPFVAREDEPLQGVLDRMRASGCPLVPVAREEALVGLVTPDNLSELLLLSGTNWKRPRPQAP
ncbi:MAG: site-2 protease family protein [Phycisphaerae bacterium]|nr:site-2 protease family protein [Phycisphaerae bacterium]